MTEVYRNRIVGQGERSASQFTAHSKNWKYHPPEQGMVLDALLTKVGWVQQVVVSSRTGLTLDGHERIAIALAKGVDIPVPYIEVDLTEEEESLVLATLDRSGDMAVADELKLAGLWGEIGESIKGTEFERAIEPLAVRIEEQQIIEASLDPADANLEQYEGEIRISPEILERQDYVVFVFDNQLDWRAVCDEFGIGRVFEQAPDEVVTGRQSMNQGMGRVIDGVELLRKLRPGDMR